MTQIDKLRHYWHYFKMDTPLFLILMGTSVLYLGEIKQGVLSVVCDKVTLPFSMETTLF
jgi:hypothetical protein